MTSVRHIYRITASVVGRIMGIYMMKHYAKYVHIHNCTWTDSSRAYPMKPEKSLNLPSRCLLDLVLRVSLPVRLASAQSPSQFLRPETHVAVNIGYSKQKCPNMALPANGGIPIKYHKIINWPFYVGEMMINYNQQDPTGFRDSLFSKKPIWVWHGFGRISWGKPCKTHEQVEPPGDMDRVGGALSLIFFPAVMASIRTSVNPCESCNGPWIGTEWHII